MEYINMIFGSVDSVASALVYLLIVLLFIFGLVKCILPVARNRATLRRASRTIRAGDKKRSWQEDSFLGKGSLLPHWSEYLNNLFFADGVYHNASNVEDYINEETVIYAPGNSGFSDALPGLMVSLGFMGTLIGLTVGLSGFNMGDEAAIMGSIETLIPGMRYAFMTSIVGVIGSVSFTLISRFVNGSAARAIDGFYDAMSRYAGVLSVDPLTQVAIYQQEQTALIQGMAKELNGQFTQRMTDAIAEAVAPLNDSLTRFVTVNTQEQMRFLDTVVTRFVSHMDNALGGRFEDLADVIDRTARNQEKILSALDHQADGIISSAAQLAQLERGAAGMLEKLESYVNRLNLSQRQLDDAYARISGNFEQMNLISRQQADYLKSVSAMQNSVSETLEYLQSASRVMTETAENFKNVCGDVQRLRGDMDAAAEQSARQLEQAHRAALKNVEDEMRRSFEALGEGMRDYTRRVDETCAAISGAVERLPGAITGASEALAEQAERMTATLNRAQRAMDDVVDRMYGN